MKSANEFEVGDWVRLTNEGMEGLVVRDDIQRGMMCAINVTPMDGTSVRERIYATVYTYKVNVVVKLHNKARIQITDMDHKHCKKIGTITSILYGYVQYKLDEQDKFDARVYTIESDKVIEIASSGKVDEKLDIKSSIG